MLIETKPLYGQLKNRIKYILHENSCGSSATVHILFKVGSRNEPTKYHGISHFIEHLFFKGTKNHATTKNITDGLYQYGAKVNAFTDYDNTGYYVKINSQYLDRALDILSDIIYNSLFRDKDIKMEKSVVINEIERGESNPNTRLSYLISESIYRGTTLEHKIAGDPKDVNNYNKEMLWKYLRKYYVPENMTISIAGNLGNKKQLMQNLDKYFVQRKMNYGKNLKDDFKLILYPNFMKVQKQERKIVEKNNDIAQTYISFGYPAYPLNHPKYYVLNILMTLLAGNMSSRLFVKLREKMGLIYTVSYNYDTFEDFGGVKILYSTFNNSGKMRLTQKLILEELEDVQNNLISQKELNQTREYIIGNLILHTEDSKNVSLFNGQHLMFLDKPVTYPEIIEKYRKINRQNIKNVAQEIFQKSKMNLAILTKH